MPTFSFLTRQVGDVLVLDVVGNLVLCPETHLMRAEIEKALAAGNGKILLNLAGVERMDSTGIGVLAAAKTAALHHKVQLKVCCPPPFVARLLQQVQLVQILDVRDEEGPALLSFQ